MAARVLVATVPDGLPHVYDLDGRYLGRSGVQNRSLAADALKRLLIERGQISYETLPVRGGTYADLDVEKVSRYLALVRAKPDRLARRDSARSRLPGAARRRVDAHQCRPAALRRDSAAPTPRSRWCAMPGTAPATSSCAKTST